MKAHQFVLIGKKLEHSFSAWFFTEKFKRLQLPYRYDLFPLEKNPFLRYKVRAGKSTKVFLTEEEIGKLEDLKLLTPSPTFNIPS